MPDYYLRGRHRLDRDSHDVRPRGGGMAIYRIRNVRTRLRVGGPPPARVSLAVQRARALARRQRRVDFMLSHQRSFRARRDDARAAAIRRRFRALLAQPRDVTSMQEDMNDAISSAYRGVKRSRE